MPKASSSPAQADRRRPGRASVHPLAPHLFVPTPERPVRAKRHALEADTRVVPHAHAWAQLAYSATGVVRLTVPDGTFLVPPSRAVWVPPRVEHAVTVVEGCELRTLYIHQPAGGCGPLAALRSARGTTARPGAASWASCRVVEVTDLLRALALALPTTADGEAQDADALRRERLITPLLLDELARAQPVPVGVRLPADKRLRALCEAVLDDPARHDTLDAWARDAGASARTLARLFRLELDTSFHQWRQQAVLARALTLAARGLPMAQVASTLGYASPSAFSAMVRRSVGAPPRRFFASAGAGG